MLKALGAASALCLLVLSASTSATGADLGPAPGPTIPFAGLFVGLGGSFNSVKLDQNIAGHATSEVYDGSTLTATGQAGGPPASFNASELTLAPAAQIGYFRHFDDSNWLWGAKFSYQYLNANLNNNRALVPQTGSFTTTGSDPVTTPFTGNVVIGSSQTTAEHEMLFLVFVGHSFANSYIYLGAGPALFGTKSRIKNAVGFADIDGRPTDVTGAPMSFSSSDWVWGGAGQIGISYFLSPAWSLDLNYTFVRSASYDIDYASGFSNPANGTTGFAHLDTSQRITSQSVMMSINLVY